MSPILGSLLEEQREAAKTLIAMGHTLARCSLGAAYNTLNTSVRAMAAEVDLRRYTWLRSFGLTPVLRDADPQVLLTNY